MAVDRGGLHYTIEVENRFAGSLANFRNGVRQARNEWRLFKNNLRDVRNLSRQAATGLRQAGISAARTARVLNETRRRAARFTREESVAAGRLASARINEQRASVALTAAKTREVRARRRVVQVEREQRTRTAEAIRLIRGETTVVGRLVAAYRQLAAAKRAAQAIRLRDSAGIAALTRDPRAETPAGAVQNQARANALRERELALRQRLADIRARSIRQRETTERQRVRANRSLRTFNTTLARSGQTANRVSFTFRRLFGILAAFAAVRLLVRGFVDIVREAVRFNAAIEQANLGIASLITAVGDVRDAQGRTVSAAEGLALAQREARRQTQLLRRDALRTAATFEQLLDTFQVAVAPGLEAGLNLDQIRAFTVQISQAAAAIGLAQNQLAEEIRSLLSGTIQARTTRIAVALGITNEDIRRARDLGVLFEFLNDRFSAFTIAGEEALGTFNALTTNLVGAFQELLRVGAEPFFINIKNLLGEIFDLITEQDPITGILEPNPDAVRVVRAIFTGLSAAVDAARDLRDALDVETLTEFAFAVGQTFVTAVRSLVGFISGVVQGARDAAAIIFSLVASLRDLTGISLFDPDNLTEGVRQITRIVALIVTMQVVLGLVQLIVGAINIAWGVVAATLGVVLFLTKAIAAVLAVINGLATPLLLINLAVLASLVAIAAAVAIWLKVMQKVLSAITGTELSLLAVVKIIVRTIIPAFRLILNRALRLFSTITLEAAKFQNFIINTVIDGIVQALLPIAQFIDDFVPGINGASAALRSAQATALQFTSAVERGLRRTISLLDAQAEALQTKIQEAIAQTIEEDQAPVAEQLGELIGNIVQPIIDGVGNAIDSVLDEIDQRVDDSDALSFDLDTPTGDVQRFSAALAELPPVILESSKAIKEVEENTQKLETALRRVQAQARIRVESIGLEGAAAEAQRTVLETQVEIQEEQRNLDKEIQTGRQNLINIDQRRVQVERRRLQLSELEQQAVRVVTRLAQDQLTTQNEIQQQVTAVSRARLDILEAEKRRDEEARTAAVDRLRVEERRLSSLEQQLDREQAAVDATLEGLVIEESAREEVRNLVEQIIRLEGEEAVTLERINALVDARIRLGNRLQQQADARLAALAQEAAFEARRERERSAAEQRRDLQLQAIPDFTLPEQRIIQELEIQREFIVERNRLNEIDRQTQVSKLEAIRAERIAHSQNLATLIAQADTQERTNELTLQKQQTDSTIRDLNSAIQEQTQLNQIALANEGAELEQINALLAKARDIIERPVFNALIDGFRQAALEVPSLYTGLFQIIRDQVRNFGDFVANTITDAFDPTKKVDLRNRFAQFLQDIGRQILQLLARIATQAAILGVFKFFGIPTIGPIGIPEPDGQHEGGPIIHRRGTVKRLPRRRLLLRPLGRAGGGPIPPPGAVACANCGRSPCACQSRASGGSLLPFPRPRGIHPRDTVPLWGEPGEFMIRVREARRIGYDFLNLLNLGRLDPMRLRDVAGLSKSRQTTVRGIATGLQTGGAVARQETTSRRVSVQDEFDREDGVTVAAMLPDDEAAERFAHGGRRGMIDFMRSVRDEVLANERVSR